MDELELFGEDPYADFDYWSKMACWSIEEATALANGRSPYVVNWAFLKNYPTHPLAVDYRQRRDLALRAQAMGMLNEFNPPATFIAWAKGLGLWFCPELEQMIRGRGGPTGNSPGSEKSLHSKERQTLMKIILAMAKEKFRFYPAAAKQHAAVAISDVCERNGTPVDTDTVRKWLSRAAEEVSTKDN